MSRYLEIKAEGTGAGATGVSAAACQFAIALDQICFMAQDPITKRVVVDVKRRKVPVRNARGDPQHEIIETTDASGQPVVMMGDPLMKDEIEVVYDEIVIEEPQFDRLFRNQWRGCTQWSAEHIPLRIPGAGASSGTVTCEKIADGADFLGSMYLRLARPGFIGVSRRKHGSRLNTQIPVHEDAALNHLIRESVHAGERAERDLGGAKRDPESSHRRDFEEGAGVSPAVLKGKMDALFTMEYGEAVGRRPQTAAEVAVEEGRVDADLKPVADFQSEVTRASRTVGRNKHYCFLCNGWPFRMLQQFELHIGSYQMEQMDGRLAHVLLECNYNESQKMNIRNMTSQCPIHYDKYDRLEWLKERTARPEVCYLPLPVSTSMGLKNAYILQIMPMSKAKAHFNFSSWENVLVRSHRNTCVVRSSDHQPPQASDLSVMLVAQHGFIEETETECMGEHPIDFLLYQHHHKRFTGVTKLDVRRSHPTTFIWAVPQLVAADRQNEFDHTSSLTGGDIARSMELTTSSQPKQRRLDACFFRQATYLEACRDKGAPTDQFKYYMFGFADEMMKGTCGGSLNLLQWQSANIDVELNQGIRSEDVRWDVYVQNIMLLRIQKNYCFPSFSA